MATTKPVKTRDQTMAAILIAVLVLSIGGVFAYDRWSNRKQDAQDRADELTAGMREAGQRALQSGR